MKKFLPILAIIIIVAALGSWYAFRNNGVTGGDANNLVMFVDRNIPPEHQARLTADIARMRAEIGDRVGDQKSMEDLNRWINIGNLYFVLGNLGEARVALREAVELNAINYVAWGNLGDTLAEMGDLAGARAAYQQAVQHSGSSFTYILKYADFLRAKFPRDADEYERVLQAAVTAHGQEQEIIARLARFYMEEERYAEAVTHYEVLVELTDGDINVRKDLLDAERKLSEQQSGNTQ